MGYDPSKRPFWTLGARYWEFGGRMIRYSTSASIIDVGATDAAFNELRKLGKTSFAHVGNRAVWAQAGNADLGIGVVLAFGSIDPVGKPFSDPFENFRAAMPANKLGQFPYPSSKVQILPQHAPEENWRPLQPAEAAGLMVSAFTSRMQNQGAAVSGGGPDYHGVFRITAYYGANDVGDPSSSVSTNINMSQAAFATAVSGASEGSVAQRVYADGSNARLCTSGSWGLVSNNPDSNKPLGSDYVFPYPDPIETSPPANYVPSRRTYAGEHPLGTDVRSMLGVGPRVWIPGMYIVPAMASAFRMGVGAIHGVHEVIQTVAFNLDLVTPKYVVSVVSREQVVAILSGQRDAVKDIARAQIDAAVASVAKMPLNVAFVHIMTDKPVGPYDIYDSFSVKQAISNGASMSDIDSTEVSGKTMAEWRKYCKAMQPTTVLMYSESMTSRDTTNVHNEIVITDEAPFFRAITHGNLDGMAFANVRIDDEDIAKVRAAFPSLYPTDDSVLAEVDRQSGANSLPDSVFKKATSPIIDLVTQPWLDLPGMWFKRCASQTLQPLANGIAAGITEASASFKV